MIASEWNSGSVRVTPRSAWFSPKVLVMPRASSRIVEFPLQDAAESESAASAKVG